MNFESKQTTGRSAPAAPLKNVRVIDLGQYIAGPGAAMVLAELGAQVMKSEGGREIAWGLIANSDVVIQNLRPGAVEALGLGPSAVRERFPKVIYLSISGFGDLGPSSARPGYDIAAQAESGLMSVTGEPDRLPQKVGVPIIDAAAAHLGAQAVLAALYGRAQTGVG